MSSVRAARLRGRRDDVEPRRALLPASSIPRSSSTTTARPRSTPCTIGSEQREKPGCAGRPAVNTRLRLSEEGEICVHLSSDEAFAGYWNRPDANEKAIRDGWYHTGDTGHLDEDGDLWIDGRVDDMIVSGGENIHPLEVEDVLARHPGVAEVAVVGAPDERWGHRVVAVVIGDATPEELDAHCLASPLARFKRPREYRFVDSLPKSPSGKILRRVIRDELEAHPGDEGRRSRYERLRRLSGRAGRQRRSRRSRSTCPGKYNRVSMAARGQLAQVFGELDADDERALHRARRRRRRVHGRRRHRRLPRGLALGGLAARAQRRGARALLQARRSPRSPASSSASGSSSRSRATSASPRTTSQLALPEATIGMIPGSGGSQRLARMIGLGRAKDIVMRGRRIGAEEALALGLVTEVVELDALPGCRRRARRRAVAALAARDAHGQARAQPHVRGPAARGPRGRGPRLRPAALERRLPRGRRGVRREAPPSFTGE